MYREDVEACKAPGIDALIKAARENAPPEYRLMPWAHPERKRGAAVLQSEGALNAHMAAYGLAHKKKASYAFQLLLDLGRPNGPFEVFDWGCGQGIASLCMLEELRSKRMLDKLHAIHLIEPSAAALERAVFNLRTFAPSIKLHQINKRPASARRAF